jgi:hypothetical protein
VMQDGHLKDFRVIEQEERGFLQDITKWKRQK